MPKKSKAEQWLAVAIRRKRWEQDKANWVALSEFGKKRQGEPPHPGELPVDRGRPKTWDEERLSELDEDYAFVKGRWPDMTNKEVFEFMAKSLHYQDKNITAGALQKQWRRGKRV
jgi:hypothetical protein